MLTSQEQYSTEPVSLTWAIKFRQPISMVVIIVCLALLLATPPSWKANSGANIVMNAFGFVLIVVAAFGRIWSSLYISGYKEDRIVTEGPYAIVRNPLYAFSFLGALGLGLATTNLLILAVIASAFLLYYPLVVFAEERNLRHKFGQDFVAYMHQVPRFLPRRLHLVEPDRYPVRPRHVRRSLLEIIWFFWSYLFLHLVTGFQQGGWSTGLWPF
jgi:protein-S-isoprenylcysteine O-methyltransferase Ste14